MATTLYKEAIAEAKQLREMAEQNAKNKIIDAVTPKIRALIERELLGEDAGALDAAGEEELADLAALADSPDAQDDLGEPEDAGAFTLDLDSLAPEQELSPELPADAGVVSMAPDQGGASLSVPAGVDVDVEIGADGSVSVDTGTVDVQLGGAAAAAEDDDDLLLSKQMAETLTRLLKHERKPATKLNRVRRLEGKARKFKRVFEQLDMSKLNSSQRAMVRNNYTKLLREAFSLYNDAILSEVESGNNGLRRRAQLILKEMKQMAYNQRTDLFRTLFEADEEKEESKDGEGKEELSELDALLTLEPADEDEAEEVEALLGDLEVEFELEEPGGEEEEAAGDEGGEDLGGEEEPLELESDVIIVDNEEDAVVEIDENMLRRELRRMRRLSEEGGVDAAVLDNFGDGSDEGDSFVDVSEDDLLNAMADELGDADMPDAGGRPAGGDAMPESRRRRARRIAERRRRAQAARRKNNRSSVNESRQKRALARQLVEYKKAVGSLRTQLTEMNLFNAKLLYANKLMQNRNVTPKQQRVVVEALDKAKTLREAKLLYQSLTASLNRVRPAGRTLKEGRVTRGGSSSRSTRSAAAKSGVEVDRWAVLAGIKN